VGKEGRVSLELRTELERGMVDDGLVLDPEDRVFGLVGWWWW